MSASLVGSEMCIRDRAPRGVQLALHRQVGFCRGCSCRREGVPLTLVSNCLLYTSDAADDM
eukprot:11435317-Alexandrium_andersonii.AAC.1